MSPYTPQTWVDHDITKPVSAARMTVIENGLSVAQGLAETVQTDVSELSINVKASQYNAVGDGTTNDTAAVQAAVTAAAGGTVFFPEGSYLITTAISVTSDTRVVGAGCGSVLKVAGPAHTTSSINGFTSASTSRVIIESLKIVGPEDGTLLATPNGVGFGAGIFFDTVADFRIRDVEISRFNFQGIYMGACSRGKVTGCTVKEMYSGNGISVDGLSVDMHIIDNHLQDIADCGIGTHNGASGTIIALNTVDNTSFGRGVDVFGAPDTIVMANKMSAIGGNGVAGRGIFVGIGLSSTVPDRARLISNTIIGCAQEGILVSGSSVGINDVEIAENKIRDSGSAGVYLSQKVLGAVITDNAIENNTARGIFLEHSGANVPTDIWVDGNVIGGHSVSAVKWTSSVTTLRFGKNDFHGNSVQPCDGAAPTVASTAALTLPAHSGFVNVTGTTNITSIVTGGQGELVTLCFAGILTFTDGSNLKLNGNFVTSADDTITLICDGVATWYEVARSAN